MALQYIGVYPDLSYLEGKKVQMLNLVISFCIPLTFFFTCTNLIEDRPLLASINAGSFVASLTALILHHYRYYRIARSILIVFNLIFFTLGGYFFHNGAEYLLLCVLIVTLLVYDNIYIQTLASCVIILAIITVVFYPSPIFSENQVPRLRVVFNFVSAASFLFIILAVFKDIQHTYQQQIAEQHTRLKEMNHTMEHTFSIIAHDIKTPLISVHNLLSLLENDAITQETSQEHASALKNHILHLNNALDNLLRWGERNMQDLVTNRTHVSVTALYNDVYPFLLPQINQKKLILENEIEEDLTVYVDPDQILVILRNILSNAIKYSFSGATIYLFAKRTAGKAIIEIKDTGTGMTDEQLRRIFNKIQIPTRGTDGEQGSGLGLLLCKELLQQNEGDFHVQSEINGGSIFQISLPLA